MDFVVGGIVVVGFVGGEGDRGRPRMSPGIVGGWWWDFPGLIGILDLVAGRSLGEV